ncbi:ATP12 family chaperone protein [Polymorphum gilvum]|uniref:ATP12 chaperone protein n=1 Tax=Polymorphum gilvum (strain LMG 25793 / CGMCC 1.9160 / SL003B-26A1) TaxID=991905 RepID=F2IUX5_POLGS|nr:ATP12 family protein [Polymorphum gilvum]ADZ70204.1 ATP12 chaperone protein [Polymorphum gilvum SL003B-26A1]
MRDIVDTLHEDAARTGPVDPVERAKELARRELPKRFYTAATAAPAEGGFAVLLDGRAVRTPGKKALVLASKRLAEAVAAEWAAQEGVINPATMPLTRIANAAIDGVAERFAAVADEIAAYAGNDALCYRAGEPARLVERQTALWDPILEETGRALGGRFVLACGLMPVVQPAPLVAGFRAALERFSGLELAALSTVTSLTGSAVLALALAEGRLTADAVWTAAHVDEDWNAEQWGEDAEATRVRAAKRAEFDAAALILADGGAEADA